MDRNTATYRALVLKEGVREGADGAEVERGAVGKILGEDADAAFFYEWCGRLVGLFESRVYARQ